MKKLLLGFFIIFVAISCTKNGYKINGTTDLNWLNGKTIYLADVDTVLDSTVVAKGKFTFVGKIDTAKIAAIWFYNESEEVFQQIVVLEKGNIDVKFISEDSTCIGGTVLNNIFMDYFNAMSKFDKKYTDAMELSDADAMQVGNEIIDFNFEFCKKNANNIIGKTLFLQNFYNFSTDRKEEIINLFSDEYKKDAKIQMIIAGLSQEKKVAIGQQFIDFELPKPNGDMLKLSDLVGKTDYLLIDFWASWCGPCVNYIPDLKSIYEKYHGKRFDILSVSLDKNRDDWQGAIAKYGLAWTQVSDLKFWQCEAAQMYAVNSIPCTVLIDKNGTIVGRNLLPTELADILDNQ